MNFYLFRQGIDFLYAERLSQKFIRRSAGVAGKEEKRKMMMI
jgi:hypothetical protein